MWELESLVAVILCPCTHTLFFFLLCKSKKALSLAWQLCILEQAPVDQVSLEKSGMCACISCLRPNRSLGNGDQHTQNSNRRRMLALLEQHTGPAQQAGGPLTSSSAYFLTEQVHSLRHQALARTPLSDIRKPSWLLSSCLLPPC